MALSYANILGDIGTYIAAIDDLKGSLDGGGSSLPDLPALYTNIETNLSDDRFKEGLQELWTGVRDQFLDAINELRDACAERMQDESTVLREMPGVEVDTSLENVLREFIRNMDADDNYVTGNTATVGTPTAVSGNTGNGIIITDTTLDAVSEPRTGFPAIPAYMGETSELTPDSDTLAFTCESDSNQGGAEGQETFSVVSLSSQAADEYDWRDGGAGENGTITGIEGVSIIGNGNFESFASDVPSSWDLDDGTAGTHVLEETTTVFKGSSALELNGDASEASIQISQSLAVGTLTPGKRYCISAWVQGDAGVSAGTLTIQLEGTGYSASSSEKIELNNAALAAQTSWGHEFCFFNAPLVMPSDLELVIKWTGTPSNHAIFVDNVFLAEALWFGGAAFHVVGGSTAWAVGDRVTVALSNNNNGTLQTAFRKIFNVQLPTSGTTQILDSVATP